MSSNELQSKINQYFKNFSVANLNNNTNSQQNQYLLNSNLKLNENNHSQTQLTNNPSSLIYNKDNPIEQNNMKISNNQSNQDYMSQQQHSQQNLKNNMVKSQVTTSTTNNTNMNTNINTGSNMKKKISKSPTAVTYGGQLSSQQQQQILSMQQQTKKQSLVSTQSNSQTTMKKKKKGLTINMDQIENTYNNPKSEQCIQQEPQQQQQQQQLNHLGLKLQNNLLQQNQQQQFQQQQQQQQNMNFSRPQSTKSAKNSPIFSSFSPTHNMPQQLGNLIGGPFSGKSSSNKQKKFSQQSNSIYQSQQATSKNMNKSNTNFSEKKLFTPRVQQQQQLQLSQIQLPQSSKGGSSQQQQNFHSNNNISHSSNKIQSVMQSMKIPLNLISPNRKQTNKMMNQKIQQNTISQLQQVAHNVQNNNQIIKEPLSTKSQKNSGGGIINQSKSAGKFSVPQSAKNVNIKHFDFNNFSIKREKKSQNTAQNSFQSSQQYSLKTSKPKSGTVKSGQGVKKNYFEKKKKLTLQKSTRDTSKSSGFQLQQDLVAVYGRTRQILDNYVNKENAWKNERINMVNHISYLRQRLSLYEQVPENNFMNQNGPDNDYFQNTNNDIVQQYMDYDSGSQQQIHHNEMAEIQLAQQQQQHHQEEHQEHYY